MIESIKDEAAEKVLPLHESNRLRHQICENGRGKLACPPERVASAPIHSPPLEGWSMHFVMHAFSNHVKVLRNVMPIDLLVQSAVLSDGVVVSCLH